MGYPARTASPGLVDRVVKLLQRVEYRRADTQEEKEAIFRLRYDAYLKEGAIEPSSLQSFSDPVDDAENTWIFGVYIDGKLASSMRLSVTIPGCTDIPALHVFPDIVGPEIAAKRTFVDPTRFVADRTLSRLHPELPYLTLRLPWLALEYFNLDVMLAAVRAEHQSFYARLWGHKPACAPRPYPNLQKPIALMMLDYRSAREHVHRRYPFFQSNYFERRMLFERYVPMPRRSAA